MNKFRIISLFALLLVFATAGLSAQRGGERGDRPAPDPEQQAEQLTQRLTKQLTLTESQQAQVQTIALEYAKKMEATRAELKDDREASRKAMGTVRTEQTTALVAVLTPEQAAKLKELEEKQGERGGRKGRGGKRGDGQRR